MRSFFDDYDDYTETIQPSVNERGFRLRPVDEATAAMIRRDVETAAYWRRVRIRVAWFVIAVALLCAGIRYFGIEVAR